MEIESPINILQLISSSGFFGAENMLLQLSFELMGEKDVNLFVGVFQNLDDPHLEIADRCRKMEVETVIFPCHGKFDFRTLFRLRQFVKEKKLAIIHSHGYKANIYSALSTKGLPVHRISTCHNWLGDEIKMKGYAILDRFFLKGFECIVAVSSKVKEKIIKSGISSDRVKEIPNGIGVESYSGLGSVERLKEDLGIEAGDTVIGTLGRLSPEKNHKALLTHAEEILKSHPRVKFLIVGDGPLRKRLEEEYGSSAIIFTGFRTDIPNLYRCMDIFVLPSLTEGLPMVLLEAMASELPVIASRVGAIPDVVEAGETGFLVEPDDESGLLKSLLYLLDHRERGEMMGIKGRQRVKEQFSSGRMSRAYSELYRAILKENLEVKKI